MSEQMTKEQEVIYQKVYGPAYLQKSAELGEPLQTEADFNQALEESAMIRMLLDRRQGGIAKTAHAALKQTLGLDRVERAEKKAAQVKAAAAPVSQDNEVRTAIMASLGL